MQIHGFRYIFYASCLAFLTLSSNPAVSRIDSDLGNEGSSHHAKFKVHHRQEAWGGWQDSLADMKKEISVDTQRKVDSKVQQQINENKARQQIHNSIQAKKLKRTENLLKQQLDNGLLSSLFVQDTYYTLATLYNEKKQYRSARRCADRLIAFRDKRADDILKFQIAKYKIEQVKLGLKNVLWLSTQPLFEIEERGDLVAMVRDNAETPKELKIVKKYNKAMQYLKDGEYKKVKKLLKSLTSILSRDAKNDRKSNGSYQYLPHEETVDTSPGISKTEMRARVQYNLASLIIQAKGLTEQSNSLLQDVIDSETSLSGKAHYKLFRLLKKEGTDILAYKHLRKAAIKAKLPYARVDYGRFLAEKRGKIKQALWQFQAAVKQGGDPWAAREMVLWLNQYHASLK